jgi:hypothetical protein
MENCKPQNAEQKFKQNQVYYEIHTTYRRVGDIAEFVHDYRVDYAYTTQLILGCAVYYT